APGQPSPDAAGQGGRPPRLVRRQPRQGGRVVRPPRGVKRAPRAARSESVAMLTMRFGAASLILTLLAGCSAAPRPDAPLAGPVEGPAEGKDRTSARSDAPLAGAAEKNDRAKIAALLEEGSDVNAAQPDGMTALHWAAHHDDLASATLLIKAGAEAKAANRHGGSPL